jgi:hypothetical protein
VSALQTLIGSLAIRRMYALAQQKLAYGKICYYLHDFIRSNYT